MIFFAHIFGQVFDQVFDQIFDQILGQGFDDGLGDRRYSVQYHWDELEMSRIRSEQN